MYMAFQSQGNGQQWMMKLIRIKIGQKNVQL
jgi:hypothetical protein